MQTENNNPAEVLNLEKENDWNSKRRFYYIAGIVLIVLVFIFYKLIPVIFPEPTCFDKNKNSNEGGVDCGGGCELMCKNTYLPLELKLAKSFKSGILENGKQVYDLLILLENKNNRVSPKKITASIDVYGSDGNKLDTVRKTFNSTSFKQIPFIVNDYILPESVNKEVYITKLFVTLEDYDMYNTFGAYDIKLLDFNFENEDTPKLELSYVSVYKELIFDKINILVLLKDSLDNIVAYNTKTINGLVPERKESLDFSWKEKINAEVKNVEIIPMSYIFYTNN